MCANSEGSGETAQMRRFACYAARLCDKYICFIVLRLMFWPCHEEKEPRIMVGSFFYDMAKIGAKRQRNRYGVYLATI